LTRRFPNRVGSLVSIPAILAVVLGIPFLASAQELITINGAGATFPFPLIDTWRHEYQKVDPGISINYQSIGSGGGVKQFTEKTVDFGASDAPLSAAERQNAPGAVHIPETIGSVVVSYNLPSFSGKGLKLSGPVLADIFLGKIERWDDPRITALNPGATLPERSIVVVHRSDGSGTTFVWTDYLSKVSPEWENAIGTGKSVEWPTGIGAPGNEGVTNAIKGTEYTIGYIELSYALSTDIPYAFLQNREGKFVEPSSASIQAAISAATSTLPRGDESWSGVSATNAAGPDSYPIASFSYLLLYNEITDNPSITEEKARAMFEFISWAITDGQQFSDELGFIPLPESVVKLNQQTLGMLTFQGQPLSQLVSEEPPAPVDWENYSYLIIGLVIIAAAVSAWRIRTRRAKAVLTTDPATAGKKGLPALFLKSSQLGDRIFQAIVLGAAGYSAFLLALVAYSAFAGSGEVFAREGFFGFLLGTDWNAVEGRESYGAFPYVVGTLASAGIAMAIGVPISIGIATFVSEISPRKLATPLSFVVELLAAVPSIIYGLWALFVFRFWVKDFIEQPLHDLFGGTIPMFAKAPFGLDIFTAGIVLAIMIIPTVSSISREVMRAVPTAQREAAYSLGATRWETVRTAVFPYARSGLVGASILGLGRAVGETMLVTMVIGNAIGLAAIPTSLFSPSQTLASLIANEFNEAVTSFHTSALIGLGAVLFLLTIAINIGARLMVARMTRVSYDKRTSKMRTMPPRSQTTFQEVKSSDSDKQITSPQIEVQISKKPSQRTIQSLVSRQTPRRTLTNHTITIWALACVVVAIIPLGSILIEVVTNGISSMVTTVSEFNVLLDSLQTSAAGSGTFEYDNRSHKLSYSVELTDLSSQETSAYVIGPTTTQGATGVLFTLPEGSSKTGSLDLDSLRNLQVAEENLFAGTWEIVVETASYPDGELGGKILPTGQTSMSFNYAFLTMPPGAIGSGEGGIGPAIQGTLIVIGLSSLIGAPVGILAGIYLSEYTGSSKKNNTRFAHAVRFFNDVLTGVPSIVIGIVGYIAIVLVTGSFSVWAGAFALSIIMIPIVVRVTEETLKIVPDTIREAAYSLGIPRWKIALFIVVPTAKSGVMTGVVLAISRITGETAPLIMTILGTSLFFSSFTGPVDALPLRIWRLASQPYESAHSFGWGAALILILMVLSLSVALRLLTQQRMRGARVPVAV
jgi:phosphate ABC transporter phosphate-binding protein/phosphate ABC transporter permease protein PstC/phosphate ABC transporter permease subunit PstA